MDDGHAIPGATLADALAGIAALKAEQACQRDEIARLARIVRAGDFRLMARLFATFGIGVPFSAAALIDAGRAEREDGSSLLADAIDAAVGRGPGQSIRLGIWLAARQADPLDGIAVRKVGATADHAALYELVEA